MGSGKWGPPASASSCGGAEGTTGGEAPAGSPAPGQGLSGAWFTAMSPMKTGRVTVASGAFRETWEGSVGEAPGCPPAPPATPLPQHLQVVVHVDEAAAGQGGLGQGGHQDLLLPLRLPPGLD